MAAKREQQKQDEAEANLNIDLTSLPADALVKLRDQINDILRSGYQGTIGPDDIVLEYDVKLLTSEGDIYENVGSTKMNKVTSKRLIVDAPRRFEAEFMHQVYEPVYSDAMDLFDMRSGAGKSLTTIKQNIGSYDTAPLPGLPGVGGSTY